MDLRYKCVDARYVPTLGSAQVGTDFALGVASAEGVPVLNITITVPGSVIVSLTETSWIVTQLVELLDQVIPLNMDFRLEFRATGESHTFRIGSDTSEEVCWLGINSALGGGLKSGLSPIREIQE